MKKKKNRIYTIYIYINIKGGVGERKKVVLWKREERERGKKSTPRPRDFVIYVPAEQYYFSVSLSYFSFARARALRDKPNRARRKRRLDFSLASFFPVPAPYSDTGFVDIRPQVSSSFSSYSSHEPPIR